MFEDLVEYNFNELRDVVRKLITDYVPSECIDYHNLYPTISIHVFDRTHKDEIEYRFAIDYQSMLIRYITTINYYTTSEQIDYFSKTYRIQSEFLNALKSYLHTQLTFLKHV